MRGQTAATAELPKIKSGKRAAAMKTNIKAGHGFIFRAAALFLAVLLAGCAPAGLQATQTESPEVKRHYRMDERSKGKLFPLYVRSGEKLIGLYYAYGKPTSREFCDDFTFITALRNTACSVI